MDDETLTMLRQELVDTSKTIYGCSLVEFGEGNVSLRVPGCDEMLITPTMNDYANMVPDDAVHIGFDGSPISGGKPSSEYRLHSAVYEKRPKSACVIHTHSPYASMLSVAGEGIPVIFEEMVIFLGGAVGVSEYATANTDELGAEAINALGDANACIMANHGVLACGRSARYALKSAQLVEKMAKVYWGSRCFGDAHEISDEAVKGFREKFLEDFSTI